MKTPLILSFQFMTDHTFLQILENDLGLTDIPATHEWLKENKKSIELKLEEHGAILFKDLPTETAEDFDQFVSTFNYDTFTYEESLSNIDTTNFKPASIIDMDCDLYSSTTTAFEFMVKHNLIQPGTIIIYDDWGGTTGYATYSDGQSRAHKEIFEKYNIKASLLTEVGPGHPHIHRFYQVNYINNKKLVKLVLI